MAVMDNNPKFEQVLVAGAFVLDSSTDRVYTFRSEMLQLDPIEFKTLWYLAVRENVYQPFNKIYKAVWDNGEGTGRREEALKTIKNVTERINTAGCGFAWIDHNPSLGYAYRIK